MLNQGKDKIDKLKVDLTKGNGVTNLKKSDIEQLLDNKVKGVLVSTTNVKPKPQTGKEKTKQETKCTSTRITQDTIYSSQQDSKGFDYKTLYEKEKEEVRMLVEKEKGYRKEIEYLRTELDKSSSTSEIKKLRQLEMDKEILTQTVHEFIIKTSKYVPFGCFGDRISIQEIDSFFNYLNTYLAKLINDNKILNKEKYQGSDSKVVKVSEAFNNLFESPPVRYL
jgi:hypothetical protein